MGAEIELVVTHRDDPNEGGWYASVARLAAEHGIPVHAPDKLDHPIWIERIKAMKPELLLSFHYRNIIPKAVRALFAKGCLNLHSSLLPKHRGRCPINRGPGLREKENRVPRRYPSQFEGDMQGGGSVNDCHRMLGASVANKVGFELIHKLAHGRDKSGIDALFDIFPLVSMESRFMQRIRFSCIRENFAQSVNHLVCQGALY